MRAVVRYAQEQRIEVIGKQGVLHADMELDDTLQMQISFAISRSEKLCWSEKKPEWELPKTYFDDRISPGR